MPIETDIKCWICERKAETDNTKQQLIFSKMTTGIQMCTKCQKKILTEVLKENYSTIEHTALYYALQKRLKNIEIIKEERELLNDKEDKFNLRSDISIPLAKLIIEVDGAHHFYNSARALKDARKTVQAQKKNYSVIRFSNNVLCKPNRYENNKSMFMYMVVELVKLINESIEISKKDKNGN